MRHAVEESFKKVMGVECDATFSGWFPDRPLTRDERSVITGVPLTPEERELDYQEWRVAQHMKKQQEAWVNGDWDTLVENHGGGTPSTKPKAKILTFTGGIDAANTQVLFDGKPINGIRKATITLDAESGRCSAVIEADVRVEGLRVESTVTQREPTNWERANDGRD